MNHLTISLSSTTPTTIETLSLVELDDHTLVSVDLNGIYNDTIPQYVKIAWGDGQENLYNNDIYDDTWDNELIFFTYNPVLNDIHTHEYYPSSTSLYKNLSAQILVSYTTGDFSYFLIPMVIRTYDIPEVLNNLKISNCNITKNELELQLQSDSGMVEMVVPRR